MHVHTGVVLVEMLNRARPWGDLAPLQIAVNVTLRRRHRVPPPDNEELCPPPLRKLIAACLEHDPKARPSAAEVAKRLTILAKQLGHATRFSVDDR